MDVPVIHLAEVLHVGTMDPTRLGSTTRRSQEGHCLSVSLCPGAWTRIARLGGHPWHALARAEGAFLDVHAARDDDAILASATDWAIGQGMAEQATRWLLWRHDDETGEWGSMAFPTEAHAFEEADPDGDLDGPGDVEGPDGRPGIESSRHLRATPALSAATGMVLDMSDDAADAVLMAWARDVASVAVPGGLDGVWWRERHDPRALSAPRGGIFPERVPGWVARVIPARPMDDAGTLGAMPDTVHHPLPDVAAGPRP